MSITEAFLTPIEEQEIVKAIIAAEKNTSGEIRVHLEEKSEKPPLERAKEVFISLKMNETKARNGVLFYVDIVEKQFAIIGDEGINNLVPNDFWETTKNVVIENFKKENYKNGLVAGITESGKQLKHFFPYETDDIDELDNEISKG